MNGEYDGSITIKTAIDTSGFVAGEKELAQSAQKAANSIRGIGEAAKNSLNRQIRTFDIANDAYKRQTQVVAELKQKLAEVQAMRVESDAWKQNEKDLAKANEDYVKLIDKIKQANILARQSIENNPQVEKIEEQRILAYRKAKELEAKANKFKDEGNLQQSEDLRAQAQKYVEINNKLYEREQAVLRAQRATNAERVNKLRLEQEAIMNQIDILEKRRAELESDGKYVGVDTSAAEAKLQAAEEKRINMLGALNNKYTTLRENIDYQRNQVYVRAEKAGAQALKRFNDNLKKSQQEAEKAAKAEQDMAKEGEQAFDRVAKKSSLSFKNILKYVVGVQTIYAMFNKIKRAASEGLQIVAQYDPQFNEVMSTMKTGISQLKADIGAMLQPILQTIVPILNMVLERLHSALTKVASVIAAIMGQDYVDVVTVKAENYAGALDNVASSAKEATKALGGYDKLNIIQSDSSGGGGGAGGALAGLAGAGNGAKYERLPIELSETWQKVVDVIHEAQDVTEEYIEAYADEGVGGVALKFAENVNEVVNSVLPDPSDKSYYEGSKFQRGLKSTINDMRQRARSLGDGFMELLLGDPTKQIGGNWGADMESATKKAMNKLGKTAPKVADIVTEPNSKAETQSRLNKTFKTVGSVLQTGAQKLGRTFTGYFNLDSDEMANKITTATTSSGSDPRVNEAATAVGKQISASIASAVDFTVADTNTVTTRTKKLLSGADSVKLEAEAVGKGVADSISRGLKATTVFSEADGKSTAGQIAKGLEAVSAEANRGGSALSNALHNIGKKISEGINKGTMSVPVTFTGQATPVAAQTNYPKVNTTVTITLDGKTISKTVFDEAERVSKQTGTGARAGLHYAYSVG